MAKSTAYEVDEPTCIRCGMEVQVREGYEWVQGRDACYECNYAIIQELRLLVADLWDAFGDHEEAECPQDDTCECPLVARVNEALKRWDRPVKESS